MSNPYITDEYWKDRAIEKYEGWGNWTAPDGSPWVARTPEPMDLLTQLREALGLPHPGGHATPKQAWEEALEAVRRLKRHGR